MQSYFTFPSFLALLGCLLIGALYAYFLYESSRNFSKRTRIFLMVGRTIVLSLIAWLLFSPLLKQISYVLEKPIVILAQDNSMSVGQITTKDFDSAKYHKDFIELRNRLAAKYEVRSFSFGDTVKKDLDFSYKGKYTNGAALVGTLKDQFQNRNVGAVILASDGIYNRGGNPVYELSGFKAPIYSIALGDTIPKRDLLIANIAYNDLVYLDNDFIAEIQIEAYQSKNEQSILSVYDGDKLLFQKQIPIESGLFTANIPVKLNANSSGTKRFTAKLSAIKNEITLRNNAQDFFVEIVDGKQEVLIAANAPHPDISALRQSIELNKHYKVTVALADELQNTVLEKFGTIILYQLPAQQNVGADFLQKLTNSKASLWFVLGTQSNLNNFNTLQPNVQVASGGFSQEVFPVLNGDFSYFNLNSNADQQVNKLDALTVPFNRMNFKAEIASLLNQRIGKVETGNPLWFFANISGVRKTAYTVGEGFWRWRLNDSNNESQTQLFNELTTKTIQYLTVKDDKQKFKVIPSKPTFEEQEQVILQANLYNDSYQPINNPDVQIKIKSETGKIYSYAFGKTATGYRLDAGNFTKGKYTYEASVNLGGNNLRAVGSFYVEEIITEFQQTTANHELMRTMALQSGGKFILPANLLDIEKEIERNGTLKTLSYEDKKYEPLIERKWLFFLILILLCGEWFIRKRYGEV